MRLFVLVLVLVLAATGCIHRFSDRTTHNPTRGALPAPADTALLTIFHGRGGDVGVVVFASDGTPVCQVPRRTHCVLALTPGHHRFYVYWAADTVDVFEADVVGGRRYHATTSFGYFSPVDEKLTPDLDRWSHLDEYLETPETALSVEAVEVIRAEVRFDAVRRRGDERFAAYDAHQIEVHTLHPDDGV